MIVAKWYEAGVEGTGWAILETTLRSELTNLRNLSSIGATAAGPLSVAASSPDDGAPRPSVEGPSEGFLDDSAQPEPADASPAFAAGLEARQSPDHYLLREVDDLLRFYLASTNLVIDRRNAGQADLGRSMQELRALGADAAFQSSVLSSDHYDLSAEPLDCSLALRAYAAAIQWVQVRALLLAAQMVDHALYETAQGAAWDNTVRLAQDAATRAAACGRS